MKVPPQIKDEITKILYKKEIAMMLDEPRLGSKVEAEQITAEEVLNALVESGLQDQTGVLAEIKKQLQA